jgi:hypothetical protein
MGTNWGVGLSDVQCNVEGLLSFNDTLACQTRLAKEEIAGDRQLC